MNIQKGMVLVLSLFMGTAIYSKTKPTMGVAPTVTPKRITSAQSIGLNECVESFETNIEALFQQSRLFVMVDRTRLKDLRIEQDLNASGLVSNTQAKKFSLVGAKYIVFPKVDSYESHNEIQNFTNLDRRDEKQSVFMTVSVKIIDATTGLIFQSTPSVVVEFNSMNDKLRPDQKVVSTKLWFNTGKKAAGILVKRITSIVCPAKVLAVNGKQVMVNRGASTGFSIGKCVAFYATESIIDTDSGETFINEVLVGEAIISRGDERKCFAMLKGADLGISKDCIVRLADNEIK